MQCHVGAINEILGTKGNRGKMCKLRMKQNVDALHVWLAPLISDTTPP